MCHCEYKNVSYIIVEEKLPLKGLNETVGEDFKNKYRNALFVWISVPLYVENFGKMFNIWYCVNFLNVVKKIKYYFTVYLGKS